MKFSLVVLVHTYNVRRQYAVRKLMFAMLGTVLQRACD